MKRHYFFNPLSGCLIITKSGKVVGGCNGAIAASLAAQQSVNNPESISFDYHINISNSQERIEMYILKNLIETK